MAQQFQFAVAPIRRAAKTMVVAAAFDTHGNKFPARSPALARSAVLVLIAGGRVRHVARAADALPYRLQPAKLDFNVVPGSLPGRLCQPWARLLRSTPRSPASLISQCSLASPARQRQTDDFGVDLEVHQVLLAGTTVPR